MTASRYSGSCHCGALALTYVTALAPAAWSVRACQCAFCRKHQALSTSDPDGEVGFSAADAVRFTRYRFALRTADFLICRDCGVYVGAVIETAGGAFGIINMHALDALPGGLPAAEPVSYAGETTAGREDRRARRWTPVKDLPWSE